MDIIVRGALQIRFTDSEAVSEITRYRNYSDGSMTALVRSTRGATSQVEYGWFVKRDIASLTLAAEQQAFRDVLLSAGFGIIGPDYVRQDDGTLIDMFGFVLGSDGSLRNVNNFASYNQGPLSRYGNVAIDGLTVSMDYCRSSNTPDVDCPNPDASIVGTATGRC